MCKVKSREPIESTPRVRYESADDVTKQTPRVRNKIRGLIKSMLLRLGIEQLLDLGVYHRADKILIMTDLFETESS
jgi:hypothetical protein